MDPTEPSLQQLMELLGQQCDGGVLAFHLAASHSNRVTGLERVLDCAYDDLISDRHLNQQHSEDALTVQVVKQLCFVGIRASHDTQNGGHCDILVRGRDRFLWIAEAKLHHNFGWLDKGFLQLSTRFAAAGYGRDHGEIIIYCRVEKAAEVLREWKERLIAGHPTVQICEDQTDPSFWFRTSHLCQNSGLTFYTRHRIVPLYWRPADRQRRSGASKRSVSA